MKHVLGSFIILTSLLSSLSSFARVKRVSIENIFSSQKGQSANMSVALKYQNLGTLVTHNEESNSSLFTPLNQQSKIMMHTKGVQFGAEIFSKQYLSLSILGQFSHFAGKDDDNSNYDENASGLQYGGGVSVNLNGSGYRIRIQPFYSAQLVVLDTDYELNYSDSGNQNLTKIFYDTQDTVVEHAVGVRFINPKTNLLSMFSIGYVQDISQKSEVVALKNSSEIEFTKAGKVENRPVSFTLGFGFMF